jgi:hypothetical protein
MSKNIDSINVSSQRPRPRVVLVVAFVAACAAAAAIALSGGLPGGGLGPGAALADAAEQTASVASGVAKATITAGDQKQETIVRFDGDDAEVTFDEFDADGEVLHRVIRSVGGQAYEQVDGGEWRALDSGGGNVFDVLHADIADSGLADAVRSASNVTRDGDVYRAQLEDGHEVQNGLLGLTSNTELADDVGVEVVAGEDGLIRRVTIEAGQITRTVTYTELGEPQDIAAPEIPAG